MIKKKKEYLSKLSLLFTRPERIADAMACYSACSVGTMEFIDIVPLFEKMMSKTSLRMNHKGVQFSCTLDLSSCIIRTNPDGLEKAIMNVIENAMDAFSDNQKPTMEIQMGRTDDAVVIHVADNGVGIDSCNLPKVFIPFFSTKPGRAGMGLPVSRNILAKMNGDIKIQSRKNVGTQVGIWIKIP